MKASIKEAVGEYLKTTDAAEKANEARKAAIRRIYSEIAGMLKEAGLDAEVIVSGNNVFNTLSLRIEFPHEGLSSRFSFCEDSVSQEGLLHQEVLSNPIDHHKSEGLQE